jgi:hypothetical protein
MCRGTFAKSRIMVVATEKPDVVIILVKVESQIATALGTFHNAGEHAGLLRNGCASAARGTQTLHLFPTDTVNDRLMDIKEDGPVFIRVFNTALHLIRLGIALEVNDIAAVFL